MYNVMFALYVWTFALQTYKTIFIFTIAKSNGLIFKIDIPCFVLFYSVKLLIKSFFTRLEIFL